MNNMTPWLYIGGFIAMVIILLRRVYATDNTIDETSSVTPSHNIHHENVQYDLPVEEPITQQPVTEPHNDDVDHGDITYTETTLDNVREFLNNLPACDWCSACGSYARYTRTKAIDKGLSIGEVTLIDYDKNRVNSTLIDGHRLNYFNVGDVTYYIDNTNMHRKILQFDDIIPYIMDTYGIGIKKVGFKDTIKPSWSK